MKLVYSILLHIILCSCNAQIDFKTIDGTITSAEFENLNAVEKNGSSVLLIDDSSKDYLRVSVKSEELYVASLCICNDKNEVFVLHASAALGQIVYKKNHPHWETIQKFDWKMREQGMNAETIAKRKNYLDNHGWIANTMGMGKKGETEFIIDRNKFKGELKLAIGLMTASDPNNIVGIPKSVGDCANHNLVSGDPKKEYDFDPGKWITIN